MWCTSGAEICISAVKGGGSIECFGEYAKAGMAPLASPSRSWKCRWCDADIVEISQE